MQTLKPEDSRIKRPREALPAETPRQQDRVLFLGLFGLALFILLAELAPRPGPWFDEFWTRYLSDPSVNLLEAFNNRWIADVHPPLFSFLVWLSAHVARLPIEQARLLNFIPLGLLTVYAVLLGRMRPRERPFLAVFAISLGTSAFFIDYFVEFRSYFTGLCAFAGLTITLVAQDRQQPDDARSASRLWCGYAVALIVSLNIHYLTTAMTVVMVGAFALAAAIRGDWRRFAIYLASGIAASLPFMAFLAYQWTTIERITHDYWLKTSLSAAFRMIVAAVAAPTWDKQILVILAWLTSAFFLWRSWRDIRLHTTALVLLLAIMAEIAMLLGYAWATSALTERYLIPLAILSASLFSIVLSRPIYNRTWLLWLFAITNVLGAGPKVIDRWYNPRWDEAAEYLSIRQSSCPNARIVPMQQDLNDRTPNTVENYNEAYAYMARKWNLKLGEVDAPSSRPVPTDCPDYYWADHFFAAGKNHDRLISDFVARWPALRSCTISVTPFNSGSAVFEVGNRGPSCKR